MSAEQAKEFIEKMKSDEEFKKRILEIRNVTDATQAIAEGGFDCTLDEIEALSATGPQGNLELELDRGSCNGAQTYVSCTCDFM